jgi:uncharacterized membrane protein YeaQ/YmgE (transglycosylase-associated protein family)
VGHFFGITVSTSLLIWILIGFLAGWLAGVISRGTGFGCLGDVLLGVVGSVLGGYIFAKLGITGRGTVYDLAAATLGAVILLVIASLFTLGRR